MVNPYLERRQGRQEVTYAHPSLEAVLQRTLGVPLFQEQLLRIAMVVAGFSGGEAEELRRAMGFKRSEKRMREIEAKLRAGMTRHGISPQAQEDIVLSITSFALYGFPESHAASFALIAYASAYLKCHYLAAFTAALLNNQPMGFYSPATIVKDAQRHGLRVLPVDVTKSEWNCTLEEQSSAVRRQPSENVVGRWSLRSAQGRLITVVGQNQYQHSGNTVARRVAREDVIGRRLSVVGQTQIQPQPLQGRTSLAQDGSPGEDYKNDPESRRDDPGNANCLEGSRTIALRLGLRYVKGLHEDAGQAIVRERRKTPFGCIDDLAGRVPELNKKELNTLAEIGALNAVSSFEFQVSKAPKGVSSFEFQVSKPNTRNSPFHRRDALWSASAAANRFGPLLENIAEPDHASPLKKMTDEERLVADFRGTGLTTGPHPMTYHRARMNKLGVRRAIDLAKLPSGRPVRIAGGVIARQRPGTAKGFVFLSLEDETGVSNAIINPDLFQKNRLLLATEQFLLIEGILQNQDGVISVKAARVSPLRITRAQTSSRDFH
jgi:error-prone DNA polymerase